MRHRPLACCLRLFRFILRGFWCQPPSYNCLPLGKPPGSQRFSPKHHQHMCGFYLCPMFIQAVRAYVARWLASQPISLLQDTDQLSFMKLSRQSNANRRVWYHNTSVYLLSSKLRFYECASAFFSRVFGKCVRLYLAETTRRVIIQHLFVH